MYAECLKVVGKNIYNLNPPKRRRRRRRSTTHYKNRDRTRRLGCTKRRWSYANIAKYMNL